jgi:hypothetical protein
MRIILAEIQIIFNTLIYTLFSSQYFIIAFFAFVFDNIYNFCIFEHQSSFTLVPNMSE